MSSYHSRTSYSSRTNPPPTLYDTSASESTSSSANIHGRRNQASFSRPPTSPQHAYSPSTAMKRRTFHSNHQRSYAEAAEPQSASYLDRFTRNPSAQQEQRESTVNKDIIRSSHMRLEARRKMEQQPQQQKRRSHSMERNASSKVSDLRSQLWGNDDVLRSASPSGLKRNTVIYESLQRRQQQPFHIRQTFSNQETTSARTSARSLSPFRRTRSASFEQNQVGIGLFQSKYYNAALAAAKHKNETTPVGRPFEESNRTIYSPKQQFPPSSPARRASLNYEKPPSARTEIHYRTSPSRSLTSSPARSINSGTSSQFTEKATFDFPEKEYRLSSETTASPAAVRGRLASRQRGLSRERSSANSGRSPSPFIENRMRAFSKGSRAAESDEEDRETPTISQHSTITSFAKRSPSIEYQYSSNRIRRHSPRHQSAERPKNLEVAAFWSAKVAGDSTGASPSIQNDTSMQVVVNAMPAGRASPNTKDIRNVDLMVKLSAVDRNNPAEALAKIDTILREESRKKSFEPILINSNNDNASDDDTAVSSLTNPTYHNPSKQKQQQQPQSDAYRGRPRPSALQNYGVPPTSVVQQNETQKIPHTTNPFNRPLPKVSSKLSINPFDKEMDIRKSSLRSHPWDDNGANPSESWEKESIVIDIDKEVRRHEREQSMHQHRGPQTSSSAAVDDYSKETFHVDQPNVFAQKNQKETSKGRIGGAAKESSQHTRMTPIQHKNVKMISDNFDAAWASMPSHTKSERATRSSGPVDLDMTIDTTSTIDNINRSRHFRSNKNISDDTAREHSIEVLLYDPERNHSQGTNSEIGTNSDRRKQSKGRGFLKAFMRRQSGKKGAASSSAYSESQERSVGMQSGSHASIGMNSGSHASTGVRSLPTPTPTPTPTPQKPNASAAYTPTSVSGFPKQQQRGRTKGQTSQKLSPRARSESAPIDRFRTASMAQKYSRVMRLYDDD